MGKDLCWIVGFKKHLVVLEEQSGDKSYLFSPARWSCCLDWIYPESNAPKLCRASLLFAVSHVPSPFATITTPIARLLQHCGLSDLLEPHKRASASTTSRWHFVGS
jgi:hypothetical protein